MVQFIREKQSSTDDWVTDRAPTMADTNRLFGWRVEVSYRDSSIGWLTVRDMEHWPHCRPAIIAWRRIRPAYQPEVNK